MFYNTAKRLHFVESLDFTSFCHNTTHTTFNTIYLTLNETNENYKKLQVAPRKC